MPAKCQFAIFFLDYSLDLSVLCTTGDLKGRSYRYLYYRSTQRLHNAVPYSRLVYSSIVSYRTEELSPEYATDTRIFFFTKNSKFTIIVMRSRHSCFYAHSRDRIIQNMTCIIVHKHSERTGTQCY